MNRFSCALVALVPVIGLLVESEPVLGQDEITIKDIKRAWTERQERIRTAKFTWKAERRVRQLGDPFELVRKGGGLPALEEATIPVITLVFGSKPGQVRFENEDASSRVSGASPKHTVGAFDGVQGTSYYHPVGEKYGIGFVEEHWGDRGDYSLVSLQLLCRPMDEDLRPIDLDILSLEPAETLVDGRKCRLLTEHGVTHPQGSTELYVDIERGYIPLRFVSRANGRLSVQNDISYTPDPDVDWVWLPASWTATFFRNDGEITSSTVNTVTSAEINKEVSDDQFRVEFPPLTRIVDKTVDTRSYSRPEAFFFKRSDGTIQPLRRLGDDPMLSLQPHSLRSFRAWVVIFNAAVASALIGYWVLRRGQANG
ncbi:MAG: hypothetical protein AB7U20_16280 [Planctomycetaceae bacterium]